jgi:RNA polymerase sigma-70 factor (sigma-E family)
VDASHEAEFSVFVRERWRDLVRAAVFLGADAAEAEDLAQQTLVRCHGSWHRVRVARNREAYVYRMLLNQLRDVRRTRWWRSRGDAIAVESIEDSSERVVLTDAVHRALATLTAQQRDVVVLRYFAQLSEAQTAAVLDIAPGTVKSRLYRALGRLAGSEDLSDYAEERR